MTRGTYAQLGSQGVTGLSYVMLDDDGSKPEPLVGEGDNLARIEVKPSFIDNVSASGQEMIDNFNQAAKRVNTLLSDDNQKQLVSTLRNIEQIRDDAFVFLNHDMTEHLDLDDLLARLVELLHAPSGVVDVHELP